MLPWCFVLLSLFVMVKTDGQLRTERCLQQDIRLKCNGLVPRVIPPNVTYVSIQEYVGSVNGLNQSVFQGPGWSSVTSLHFHQNQRLESYYIGDRSFSTLSRLTLLKINSSDLDVFTKYSFVGLDSLKVLDLSDCVSLDVDTLVSALSTEHVLPSIDTLLLENVGSIYNRVINLNRDFFDMLWKRNISTLSLANTNVYVRHEDVIHDALRHIPLVKLNVSHINIHSTLKSADIEYILKHTKVLDISGYKFRNNIHSKPRRYSECFANKGHVENILALQMEQIYANNMILTPQPSYLNHTSNMMNCSINLKLLHLRQCKLDVIDIRVNWPMGAPKLDFDISSNAIRVFYIRGHMPVFKLNLSHNNLSQMETRPDFVEAFHAFPLLEELDLESNGLHNLPRNIFLHNTRLLRIGLRKNYLTTLSFDVRPLESLSTLDLNQNMIADIDNEHLSGIRDLQLSQEIHNKTAVLKVDFRQNDIKCSCQNYEFSRWISTRHHYIQDPVYNLSCRLDTDHFKIDEEALGMMLGICRQALKTVVLLTTLFVVVVISVSVVLLWKRMVKKIETDWFIEQFIDKKTQEQYLALISHSNRDREIVFNHIKHQLEDSMRRVVPVEFDLICMGDTHFKPGRSIVDEIHRTVSESCVVIFVISQAFCESGYCLREMKEAYAQNKPLILMFLEEIDEQRMPPLVNSIFTNFSRVKIAMDNGDVVLTPTCDSITQSIIMLAVNEMNRTAFSSCWRRLCPKEYRIVQQNI